MEDWQIKDRRDHLANVVRRIRMDLSFLHLSDNSQDIGDGSMLYLRFYSRRGYKVVMLRIWPTDVMQIILEENGRELVEYEYDSIDLDRIRGAVVTWLNLKKD